MENNVKNCLISILLFQVFNYDLIIYTYFSYSKACSRVTDDVTNWDTHRRFNNNWCSGASVTLKFDLKIEPR